MRQCIAILGTMDSKGEEHLFLKQAIESKGSATITIDIGTTGAAPFPPDYRVVTLLGRLCEDRASVIEAVIRKARELAVDLYRRDRIAGIISAGGGTGTFMASAVMRALPLGLPKFILSTVASRDMADVVGTRDIAVMHSVVDMLGLNSISRIVLAEAAGAICGMVAAAAEPNSDIPRVALSLFGFITRAAMNIKSVLEAGGFEVVPFHANGTGGMAMEEMMKENRFAGVLDLATHELADAMFGGYCGGIGPDRLMSATGNRTPRLVVPGGLDAAVLEFDRNCVPECYQDRKTFFYDFRSAIRLTPDESRALARTVAAKLNDSGNPNKVLIPLRGWCEADKAGDVLFDPEASRCFYETLEEELEPKVEVLKVEHHINDSAFAAVAADLMMQMIRLSDRR